MVLKVLDLATRLLAYTIPRVQGTEHGEVCKMSRETPETAPLDPSFRETITMYDRQFQKYSLDHRIYCVPTDEVGLVIVASSVCNFSQSLHELNRVKHSLRGII